MPNSVTLQKSLTWLKNNSLKQPAQCAVIPLQQFAIKVVEKYACSLLHNASAKGHLSFPESASLALAVPTLFAWGRRKLALQCALVVHAGMKKAIHAPHQALQPDYWLTFAYSMRALRQPEVFQQQGKQLLQQICAYIIDQKPSTHEVDLSFLAALYEVQQSEILLEGTALETSLFSQAGTYWTPKAQAALQTSFWHIRAVAQLITSDAGVLLLQNTLKGKLFCSPLVSSWDSVIKLGSLAQAAQEVKDSATAETLFQAAASMLEELHSIHTEPEDSHLIFTAASVFLDALSAKLNASFVEAFPSLLDSIDPADGRLDFVMQNIPDSFSAKILDIGCGKGRYLHHINKSKKAYSLYAEDIHPDFISYIHAGVTTSIGFMLRSSHEDASLDTVLLCEVLEHCVDLQAAIGELYRILKENGRVIIIDKNMHALGSWQGVLPSWEQWFDVQKLATAFKNQGFDIIRCEENLIYEGKRRDGLFFGLALAKAPAPIARTGLVEEQRPAAPLVSIVLPTFNHLSYLPLAIDSILAQSYDNFELIVVDDGSEDGTSAYLDTLTSPKIKVITGPNTRLPAALNRGFAKARGELLTWTSADNICLPNFLHVLVSALTAYPQAGFAYGPFDYIDAGGHVFGTLSGQDLSLHASIVSNAGVASFLYRRFVAEQAGQYDPRVEGAEDWDMWLRMLEITTPVYADATIYQYRYHRQSMTATIPEKVRVASERVAIRSLERIEKNGGITVFFPQLAHCSDKKAALFYANRELGSRMLYPHSFLKKYAARYLQAAHAIQPQDICTIANYATALECCGQHKEALGILDKAAGLPTAIQLEPARQFVTQSRGRIRNLHETAIPVFVDKAAQSSELMQKIQAERLVFTPIPPFHISPVNEHAAQNESAFLVEGHENPNATVKGIQFACENAALRKKTSANGRKAIEGLSTTSAKAAGASSYEMLLPKRASKIAQPLNSHEWAQHYNLSALAPILEKIEKKEFTWQTQEMLKLSCPGESVLEIGCGSGETSLTLALLGRQSFALDFAQPSLELVQAAAKNLECRVNTVFADATQKLPFADNEFDIAFQAGLLEHFERAERIRLLKLWGRVCKKMGSSG